MSLALTRRLAASQPWLDRLADRIQPTARDLLGRHRGLHDLLDGTWLGAPLHPALTDVPIGSWVAAFVLDTVAAAGAPAAGRAANAALVVGTVSAVPTALTGVGDWRDLRGESRRIATLHGVLNTVGVALAVASLAQRARGCHSGGRALSTTGLCFSLLAGHLGGQLSFGLGVRVNRSSFDPRTSPADFTGVLKESELAAGSMRTVDLDGSSVLVTRDQAGNVRALANTCSHLGGPLASGERSGDVVTCPWHGSRFDVCTGQVVEGPAVFPQLCYETRVRNGTVELRRPRPDTRRRPTRETSAEAGGATGGADGGADRQQPGFESDIRPLFRKKDIEAMSEAFDLSSYDDVRDHAENIYQRLSAGDMPCDDAWPAERVQKFHAWMQAGCPR